MINNHFKCCGDGDLDTNNQDVVVSLIAPYRWLREEFKERHKVNEIYLHTTKIRGREHYFVEEYEAPTENFLDLDTTDISVEASTCVVDYLGFRRTGRQSTGY